MDLQALFNLLSLIVRYVLIVIVYLFILNIVRMIYLDIRSIGRVAETEGAYLKVVNRLDSLGYKMNEYYTVGDGLTLGRQKNNDVVIKDQFVSKRHCRIGETDGAYFLEDLGSANGTYLNGERIATATPLQDGDYIGLGKLEFIFVEKGGDEA